jgi:hypothetical protein
VHDKASLLALPLEDAVPPAVREAAAQEAAARRARRSRHVRDALRALGCGHGVHWAADITTLPLRFVVAVARAYDMTDGAGGEYGGLPAGRAARRPGWAGKAVAP